MTELDLPSLSTRPSYQSLFRILKSLEIKPTTWDESEEGREEDAHELQEVNAWLPTIFRSSLGWFVDDEIGNGERMSADDQRDQILDLAARRVAERCGRSGTYPSIPYLLLINPYISSLIPAFLVHLN